MHAMHARLPVNFVLEERLERYADAIEVGPTSYKGRWRDACQPLDGTGRTYDGLNVDLGCGKGAFVVSSATRHPRDLYIGIDGEPLCMAYASQHILEAGVRNAIVVPAFADALPSIFAAGEVDTIHLNFPTPYPRKRDATKRLVALERLMEYRSVLAPGGTIRLRTDSQPLRDFALTQLELAGYTITFSSNDGRTDDPLESASEYEQRLVAQGAPVLVVWATPGALPTHVEQTASLSLVDYLPNDLFEGRYVPHGMQQTVRNLRNRRR